MTLKEISQILLQFPKRIEEVRKQKNINEASTKLFLINPFIDEVLGYSLSSPADVQPEFGTDFDFAKTGLRVDYAILHKGNPIVLIEAKKMTQKGTFDFNSASKQLQLYFQAAKPPFALVTDGVTFYWFKEAKFPGDMDMTPFLTHDINEEDPLAVEWLSSISKNGFDLVQAKKTATKVRVSKSVKEWVSNSDNFSSDSFLKFLNKDLKLFNTLTNSNKNLLREALRTQFEHMLTPKPVIVGINGGKPVDPTGGQPPSIEGKQCAWWCKEEGWAVEKYGVSLFVHVLKWMESLDERDSLTFYRDLSSQITSLRIGEDASKFHQKRRLDTTPTFYLDTNLDNKQKNQILRKACGLVQTSSSEKLVIDQDLRLVFPFM